MATDLQPPYPALLMVNFSKLFSPVLLGCFLSIHMGAGIRSSIPRSRSGSVCASVPLQEHSIAGKVLGTGRSPLRWSLFSFPMLWEDTRRKTDPIYSMPTLHGKRALNSPSHPAVQVHSRHC